MNNNDYQDIGGRIKAARETFRGVGMSQTALSEKLGYKHSSRLAFYEKGLRKATMSELNRIAELLEIPVMYLLTGSDPGAQPLVVTNKADAGMVQSYRVAIPWLRGAILGAGDEECFEEASQEMYDVPSWIITGQPEKHLALTPIGMSMYPRIEPGALVIVKRETSPGTGVLVCACSPAGVTYVKGSVLNRKSKRIELHSVNEDYKEISELEGWTMVGGVVAIKNPYSGAGLPNLEWNEGSFLRFQ